MNEATPGGGQPEPIGRFDWERIVKRAHIDADLKGVALVMATTANTDGSNARPGRELLADIFDKSVRWAEIKLDALVGLGLLKLVRKGGGTNRTGSANVYQLTTPGETLPMRLDPDNNRIVPPKVGRRPKLTGAETKRASLQRGVAEILAVLYTTDANTTSGQEPVENPIETNHGSPQPAAGSATEANRASGDVSDRSEQNHGPKRTEPCTETNAGSPYQLDQPLTNTPRVVLLGGERHLPDRGTVHRQNQIDPLSAPTAPLAGPMPTVGEDDYQAARDLLLTLPDLGQFLLARAAAEFAGEGWTGLAAHVLAVRAAEIATRPEPRSA